jgi:radical SAM superfamily enzyme YgiQ (UPF0313 family)
MIKISLVNPGESTGEGTSYGPLTSPHMGLAYIASFLKSKGHDVDVIEMPTYRMSYEDAMARLKRHQAKVVGLTARSFNILSAHRLADLIKAEEPNVKIILGGAHATALPELTLEEFPAFDALCVGYGELPFLEFVERYDGQYQLPIDELTKGIQSFCYRKDGKIIKNPIMPPIRNLDDLPYPDFSMYDLSKFGSMYHPLTNRFHKHVSMFASRGCPYKCVFCMPHGGGGKSRDWNARSPENVVGEMEYVYKKTGITVIAFNDSTFGINKSWFLDVCDLIKRRGLHQKMNWSFETRANLANLDILEAAVSAGCNWVFFGFESGSDSVLQAVNKRITKNDIRMAVRNCRKANVPYVSASFIVGLPGETKATIEETAQLIREIQLDTAGINIAAMYPGTDIYDMVQNGKGGLSWADPSFNLNWTIYDRKKAHIRVNELSPDDLEEAASYLRQVGIESASKRKFGKFSKSSAYMKYYIIHDRKKLWFHIREGLKPFFR